ncbi:hypothetical protein [Kitasatospora sp. NPDC001527]|uniref:hypothetical protein n=1 Tax=Kitasatospora sp. NPDC001527 TaxID=3154519 RepID=UPI00332BCBF2
MSDWRTDPTYAMCRALVNGAELSSFADGPFDVRAVAAAVRPEAKDRFLLDEVPWENFPQGDHVREAVRLLSRLIREADSLPRPRPKPRKPQPPIPPSHHGAFTWHHIPQYLPEEWLHYFDAPAGTHEALRRAVPVHLVKMIAGGSVQDCAERLGVPFGTAAWAMGNARRRLADADALDALEAGLQKLADHLDAQTCLVDYHRRRQALVTWSLSEADWRRLSENLPERTGRRFDDAVRRDTAAVLIWTDITQSHSHQAYVVHRARAAALPARSPLLQSLTETRYQRRCGRAWELRPIAEQLDAYARDLATAIDRPCN